jgi:hypothetical protein
MNDEQHARSFRVRDLIAEDRISCPNCHSQAMSSSMLNSRVWGSSLVEI